MNINQEDKQSLKNILAKYFKGEDINLKDFTLKLINHQTLKEYEVDFEKRQTDIKEAPDFVLIPSTIELYGEIQNFFDDFHYTQQVLVNERNVAYKKYTSVLHISRSDKEDIVKKINSDAKLKDYIEACTRIKEYENNFFTSLRLKCKEQFTDCYFELPALENFPNIFNWNIVKNNTLAASLKFKSFSSILDETNAYSSQSNEREPVDSYSPTRSRIFSLEYCNNPYLYVCLAADYISGIRTKLQEAEYLVLKYKYDTQVKQIQPESFFMPHSTNLFHFKGIEPSFEPSHMVDDFPLENAGKKFPITSRVFYEDFSKTQARDDNSQNMGQII